jgi:hypothetical protein
MHKGTVYLLICMTACFSANAEIISDNYFGRSVEMEFKKTFGWKTDFIFREKKATFLPTLKNFNDQIEFECVKGVDASLSARANHHAGLFIRYCEASLIRDTLAAMEKNLQNLKSTDPLLSQLVALTKIDHFQSNINGKRLDTYQIRAFYIGHGIGEVYFTITTSPSNGLAAVTWIVFANEEKYCLSDVFCKFESETVKEFSESLLINADKFLLPHINEFKSHLVYPMVMKQWENMGSLRDLVEKSRAFEKAGDKYPKIDSEKAFQYSDFAGQLNKQKDGTYRMYLIFLTHFGNDQLTSAETIDARKIVLTNFDNFMDKHLKSLLSENE